MSRVYTVPFRINNLAAARTLLYITAATNRLVQILSTEITNEDIEANEQLVACWQKITTLGTPTATTLTPTKHEAGDVAAASTYRGNVTASEPTYGASAQDAALVDIYGLKGFASLMGYWHAPSRDEELLVVSGGDSWGLRLLTTPTLFDLALNVVVREIG